MKYSFFKNLTIVFVIMISFVLVIWGMDPSIARASEKKPVKIGLLSPFSPPGDVAAGKRMKWGAELAIKYINKEMGGVLCGRPVKLVVEDDAGTPAEGVAGYRRLVQKDGVVAVVGQYHSSVCLAVTEVSKDLGVPVFASGASSPKITESHYPTIFSIIPLTPDRVKAWIGLAKKNGWKRWAFLGEDTDYSTSFVKWLKKYEAEGTIELKTIIFPRTATDLTPALLETKAWKPDFLINVGVGAAAYLMVKQAYDIGLFPKVPMLASYDWPARSEFWDAVGRKGKYILYEAYYKPGVPIGRLGNWMVSRYMKLHNETPTFFPVNVFGEILAIAQALNMAQSANPKDLIKALTSWPFLDSYGVVQFKNRPGMYWHQASPPIIILQQTKFRQKYQDSKMVWPPKFGGNGEIERP